MCHKLENQKKKNNKNYFAEINIKELKALWKTATCGKVDSTKFN